MTLDERLEFLQEQFTCGKAVYTWYYSPEGELLSSNCPYEASLASAFELLGGREKLRELSDTAYTPVFMGVSIGMIWIISFEREDTRVKRAVVLGPVFAADISQGSIRYIFRSLCSSGGINCDPDTQRNIERALEHVPAINMTVLSQYGLMLHYCLTGEKIASNSIEFANVATELDAVNVAKRDRHKIWQAEQQLLQMVREGNKQYQLAQSNVSLLSNGVPIKSADPLRQAKTSVIVFISLCVRAAIEGGLSPDLAYSMGDTYIQAVESAADITEIAGISAAMYDAMVTRVHNAKMDQKYSRQIAICCEYIEAHVEDKITVEELAKRVGYTEYYLTRKFRDEVGIPMKQYIKNAKMERAKFLLATTDEMVFDIAEKLNFCSRSYFGEEFRKIVGCSPLEYREANRK